MQLTKDQVLKGLRAALAAMYFAYAEEVIGDIVYTGGISALNETVRQVEAADRTVYEVAG